MMRLFIGVRLPENLRTELDEYLNKIKTEAAGWRWTKPANLHFTLKFLGETDPRRIPEIKAGLAGIAAGTAPFSLQLGQTGVFPSQGIPRILWVDAAYGGAELISLAGKIEAACAGLGFPAESKPFRPHLTIARAGDRPAWPITSMPSFRESAGINSFSLIESVLRPDGPIYKNLEDLEF